MHPQTDHSMSRTAATPLPGPRLGPYVLDAELGRGSSAGVWRALLLDDAHPRHVAIKLLRPADWKKMASCSQRMVREQQALSACGHPHVAAVLRGDSVDPMDWFAMEWVDGLPITDYAQSLQLGLTGCLRLLLQALDAVSHMHQCGWLHRDLKPAHLLVNRAGQVKLIDFDSAVRLEETELQDAGQFTPVYAAPEQLRGGRVGSPADVYALGVILFELLAGRRPFSPHRSGPLVFMTVSAAQARTAAELVLRADLRETSPGQVRALNAVLRRALATDPEQRPTAQSFAAELRDLL